VVAAAAACALLRRDLARVGIRAVLRIRQQGFETIWNGRRDQ